jgi:hypothetical protein
MRIAAFVLGIIGALAIGGVGAKWVSDYNKNKEVIQALDRLAGGNADVKADMAALHSARTAGTLGVLFSVVSLVGAGLALAHKRVSVVLLAAAGIVPGLWAAKMLVCGAPLVLAAIFAFIGSAKRRTAPPMVAGGARELRAA